MRLIFMGTPETAVPTLRRCVEDGHQVVAVWTQPDRPAGRGNKLTSPPVKEYALAQGLTVYQPSKIKTAEAQALFASHDADAAVVVAYGRILPASFLETPRRGCLNVHFSLLPKYRGAAPVNWAIVRGERETGVTTMRIDEGLDTGAILLQRAVGIREMETAPQLMARLAPLGADLLGETLARWKRSSPARSATRTRRWLRSSGARMGGSTGRTALSRSSGACAACNHGPALIPSMTRAVLLSGAPKPSRRRSVAVPAERLSRHMPTVWRWRAVIKQRCDSGRYRVRGGGA